MKLRNFKKSLNRRKGYWHEPRVNSQIFLRTDGVYVYYTCHRLSMTEHLATRKREYVIRKK